MKYEKGIMGCFGIEDEAFIRGKVPMTKAEVRAISLSKLKILDQCKVLDIGAGTGSVSIECALNGAYVVAVEKNEAGVELIKANQAKFQVEDIQVIHGIAPDNLPIKGMFDRVFIGGSGGQLNQIMDYVVDHLLEEGILVANTITIENTGKLIELLKIKGFESIQVVQLQVSKSKEIGDVHMMMAHNPVNIIKAVKSKENA